MGFGASSVTKLDYDFTPWADDGDRAILKDAKGDIPEPSALQIAEYWGIVGERQRTIMARTDEYEREIRAAIQDEDDERRDRATDEFRKWEEAGRTERRQAQIRALAEVCSHQPDIEVISALPGRVFTEFERYIQEAVSPLGSTPGTNR